MVYAIPLKFGNVCDIGMQALILQGGDNIEVLPNPSYKLQHYYMYSYLGSWNNLCSCMLICSYSYNYIMQI